jgi:hypothetical protein
MHAEKRGCNSTHSHKMDTGGQFHPADLPQGKGTNNIHWTGSWVDHTTSLDHFRSIDSSFDTSIFQAVAQSLY